MAEDPADIVAGQGAREALSHHVRFSQPWQYDLMLLWAAQPYLRSVLPDECCVNLAFSGPKSSGKTKATAQIAARLTPNSNRMLTSWHRIHKNKFHDHRGGRP